VRSSTNDRKAVLFETGTLGADYDIDGRLSVVKQDGAAKYNYAYDTRGRRVRRKDVSGNPPKYEVYGLGGELLGVYGGDWYWTEGYWHYVFRVEEERVYFAGRVVARLDESGSARSGPRFLDNPDQWVGGMENGEKPCRERERRTRRV